MRSNSIFYLSLVLSWLASAALLGGCAGNDAEANANGVVANCEANDDCPARQMCRSGLCSVRASAATSLDFRFIPPSSSDFLSQHIEDVQVRTEQKLDFGLERAITVNSGEAANNGGQTGGIRFANRITGPNGTLLFRPARADDQFFSHEAHVDDGSFSARITPGRYSLTFIPEDQTQLPKKTWPDEDFESNTNLLRTLRAAEDLVDIEGTLSRNITVGGSTTPQNERVSGARVYALSTDGRHASTVVTSDADGHFNLKVEPDTGTYDIFVVPTESSPQVLSSVDEAAFEITGGECTPRAGSASDTCRLTVDLGAYPAEPVPVQVAVVLPEGFDGSADLAGSSVVVSGTVAAGTYTRNYDLEFAEQSGRWQAELELFPIAWSFTELPRYTIEIVPPARSPFARTTHWLEGAIDLEAIHEMEIGLKRHIRGEVVDSEGRTVSAAKLDFRVAANGDSESHDTRGISVTTEADGSFEVWLEQADYDVFVVPPPNTGQPRVLRDVSSAEIEAGNKLVLELPRPAVLIGSVVGARDANADRFGAVGDVTVEAYRVVGDRTIVFGQGRTDANGEFRMAISSEL